jgi:DNA invertase Pin-like site-specific DNA recombinase
MKILYTRISSLDQSSDRQKVNSNDYDMLIEDTCSGSIPFLERTGGKKVMTFIDKEIKFELHVHQIDRMARDLRDIINTIHLFNSLKIPIYFIQQGLMTIGQDGKENPISKMMISILATVGEMERNQIRERQLEGISIAKARGVYKGRNKGTKENPIKFLTKEKNKKATELLDKGYKNVEVAKITGLHLNTITKIKKLYSTLNSK